jgi:hypothetical protein
MTRKRSKPAGKASEPDVTGMTLYWHPVGHRNFKIHAASSSEPGSQVKLHDLVMQAIEEFARKHNISGPFRTVPRAHAR